MAHEAVPCPIAKEIDALGATTQRVLCALPPAALAEADLRAKIRACEWIGTHEEYDKIDVKKVKYGHQAH